MPGELQPSGVTGRSKHKPYSAASLSLRQLIELYSNAPGPCTTVGKRKSVRPTISAAHPRHCLPHCFLAVIDILLMPNAGSSGGLIEHSELESSGRCFLNRSLMNFASPSIHCSPEYRPEYRRVILRRKKCSFEQSESAKPSPPRPGAVARRCS